MTNQRLTCKHRQPLNLINFSAPLRCNVKAWPVLVKRSHGANANHIQRWNLPNTVPFKLSDCLNWGLSCSSRPHLISSCQTLRYFTCCLGVEENNAQQKHSYGHQLSKTWVSKKQPASCLSGESPSVLDWDIWFKKRKMASLCLDSHKTSEKDRDCGVLNTFNPLYIF